MNKIIIAFLLIIVLFFSVDFAKRNNYIDFDFNKPKVEVSKDFEETLLKTNTAFDNAEKKFLEIIEIDDGTNPDASKCICKGTGVITQGDGHTTSCKYHGKKSEYESLIVNAEEKPVTITESQFKDLEESLKNTLSNTSKLEEKIEEMFKENEKIRQELYNKTQITTPKEIVEEKGDDLLLIRADRPQNTKEKTYYQIIVFGAAWCQPCLNLKNELYEYFIKTDIKMSKDATGDIRFVDIDRDPDFYNGFKENTKFIPLIVELKDNVIVSRETGFKTLEQILDRYDLEKK